MTQQLNTFIFVCLLGLSLSMTARDHEHQIGTTKIVITEGDICSQPVQAIVNAAKASLEGGSGIDGAIHQADGRQELHAACLQLPVDHMGVRCPTGSAKITPAHKLKQNGIQWIVHAVGPMNSHPDKENLLRSAYTNSLLVAMHKGITSLALPAISAGIYGYDIHESAPVALKAIIDFVTSNPNTFKEIRFVCYPQATSNVTKKSFYVEYIDALSNIIDHVSNDTPKQKTIIRKNRLAKLAPYLFVTACTVGLGSIFYYFLKYKNKKSIK